jgi:ubiquitin carboxyl-terminal hydrolase 25/28
VVLDATLTRTVVRQLRLLFLQLYKSEQPAVRPDEELAYLAITRPEVDQYVEPPTVTAAPITLDSIPDIPNAASPSSTAVATPSPPPMSSEFPRSPPSSHSVLGKRVSEDRDSDGSSPEDRTRRKSEGVDADLLEEQVDSPTAMETEEGIETDRLETTSPARGPDSPSVGMGLAELDLKSPEREFPPSQPEQGDEMPSIVPAGLYLRDRWRGESRLWHRV